MFEISLHPDKHRRVT